MKLNEQADKPNRKSVIKDILSRIERLERQDKTTPPATPDPVQKFGLVRIIDGSYGMSPAEDGDWVKFTDYQALQSEVDRLKADRDQHAVRASKLASERNAIDEKRISAIISLTTVRNEVEQLTAAINWACGCGDDAFDPPKDNTPRYWWRKELTEKAGLVFDREHCEYLALKTTTGEG